MKVKAGRVFISLSPPGLEWSGGQVPDVQAGYGCGQGVAWEACEIQSLEIPLRSSSYPAQRDRLGQRQPSQHCHSLPPSAIRGSRL
jgi:hypothetical protein